VCVHNFTFSLCLLLCVTPFSGRNHLQPTYLLLHIWSMHVEDEKLQHTIFNMINLVFYNNMRVQTAKIIYWPGVFCLNGSCNFFQWNYWRDVQPQYASQLIHAQTANQSATSNGCEVDRRLHLDYSSELCQTIQEPVREQSWNSTEVDITLYLDN
jgi:hypothetical protein